MTVGQTHTENKIYSDIRNYASESTPLRRFKTELQQIYGKDRFWKVIQELKENQEIEIKSVENYGKYKYEAVVLLKTMPNTSAYSLSVLNGCEVQRLVIKPKTALQDIAAIVCTYFNVKESEIQVKSRKREIVQIRQICHYFQKTFTDNSLKTIGKYWSGKDHSTVIHSVNTVQSLSEVDKKYNSHIKELRRIIISRI